jgi:hypothetical protein
MANKVIVVIAFDAEPDNPGMLQQVMETAKPTFEKFPGLQLFGANQETAAAIISFLQDGLPEPEEPKV